MDGEPTEQYDEHRQRDYVRQAVTTQEAAKRVVGATDDRQDANDAQRAESTKSLKFVREKGNRGSEDDDQEVKPVGPHEPAPVVG